MSVAIELEHGQPGLRLVEEGPGPQRLEPLVLEHGAVAAGIDVKVLEAAVTTVLAGGPDEVDPGWKYEALCRGENPDTYFPDRGAGRRLRALVDRCLGCPVQAPCLAAALAGGEREGVWGGTTGASRKRLRDVLREAGIMGVVGEQAYLAWQEPGADREPPLSSESRFTSLEPWPHQLAAVDAVCAEIANGGKCQVALATASGKTHVGLWVAERLGAQRVLVLVPNLALIAQTADIWAQATGRAVPPMLAVCSDTGELALEATTDPARVLEFLGQPGPAWVFATYQSSFVLAEAAGHFDLTVADEAHHLTGHIDKHYAAIVRREISTDRTLYMTATPRQFRRRKADVDLVGMDDLQAFGPRVFDFPLSEAVEAGVVADYRVVVAAVERDVFERVARRLADSEVDPHLLAGAIAVVRAMGELDLSSCLSFHTRVDRARSFSALVGKVAEALAEMRPPGPGWAGFVHGGASVRIRRRLLSRLADESTWGVLANAKALGEGVDLPTLDAVAIVDPKNAEADVVQATGRALRRPGKGRKDVGTVLLPVLLNDGADPDDPLAGVDERSAQLVAGVLRALRSHDSELSSRLDITRRQLGHKQMARPDAWAILRRKAARGLLRSRIQLWVPGGATGDIAGALALQVVRESTEVWEEAYGRLLAFVEQNGHARPAMAGPDAMAAGASTSLGAWCSRQRTLHKRGLLPAERSTLLESLPGWSWTPRDEGWWEKFDALADYVRVHGRFPTQAGNYTFEWKGHRVAQMVNEVRQAYKKDGRGNSSGWLHLFPDRIAALEALPGWVWNERDAEWEQHFAQLERWVDANGHADPRQGDLVDGFDIGRWVSKQRSRISGITYTDNRRGELRQEKLSDERVQRLRSLPGWIDNTRTAMWEEGFRLLRQYIDEHGQVPPQKKFLLGDFNIGRWIASQRHRYAKGTIEPERMRRLEEIPGWVWTPQSLAWPAAYERLVAFAEEHGSVLRLPEGKVDGFCLGGWATNQRRDHARGTLSSERTALLEQVPGWVWSVPEAKFERALAAVEAFVAREGHCAPYHSHREDGIPLRSWITRMRREHERGELTPERAAQLERLDGWTWDPPVTPEQERRHLWEGQFTRLHAWAAEHGHASPDQRVIYQGTRLGGWVNKQRAKYRRGVLSDERIARLESLPGWKWGKA